MIHQAPNNILYDPKTLQITALLDYDFSSVSHPSYEFLRSFDGYVGQFKGWSGNDDSEELALHDAKLHGFPSPLPASTEDGVNWEAAKAWEDQLEMVDALRPSTIEGIDDVADIDAILRGIAPWRLTNSTMLRVQSEGVLTQLRDEGEKNLAKMLKRLGF